MSAYAYTIADLYPITFALHTDYCPRKLVDTWLRPLLEIEIEQAKRGELTAFQSHMCYSCSAAFSGIRHQLYAYGP